ncbi:hypothetical protein HLB44_36465 [Aquincola sp. S2]|uniref:Uncharacterized protein n=1 Tax=Pseudaquabacterium terrae TaxID=2732868 RepID=A0ABX2EV37_9BURK|nr:hypothetical protein [Aquabacterium terrae]NRF72458.1 hypothetical protein [Aquabacterium terrae]
MNNNRVCRAPSDCGGSESSSQAVPSGRRFKVSPTSALRASVLRRAVSLSGTAQQRGAKRSSERKVNNPHYSCTLALASRGALQAITGSRLSIRTVSQFCRSK